MACEPAERLLQTLRVTVPGATDAIIQLQLFNTIDEHLRRSSAWRYAQDIVLEENVAEYSMTLPPDAVFVRMLNVAHNGIGVPSAPIASGSGGQVVASAGVLVPELTFPDGDASYMPASSDLASGYFSYAIYRPETISVFGQPDADARQYPLQAVMALSISPGCMECACGDWQLERWMYDMFFQDWLDGSLMKLFSMPAKPWTSKELMALHGKRFRNAMAFRKQEAVRGFVWDKPMWRYPGTWTQTG